MTARHAGDLEYGSASALLAARAGQAPDRVALLFEGDAYTYRHLDEKVSEVAAALSSMGLGRGDSVCVYMSNRPEYLFAALGIGRAGMRYVPVNTAYKGSFLDYVVAHSDAAVIITEAALMQPLEQFDALPERVRAVVVLDGTGEHDLAVPTVAWSSMLADAKPTDPPVVTQGDIAGISYTSGTTGRSKGVLSPAFQSVVHAREAAVAMGTTSNDRIYTCLPLFHGAAFSGACVHAFYSGGVVCLSRRFSASNFWNEIRAAGATQFQALGSILPMLLAQPSHPNDADHQVQRVFAAPAPPDVLFAFEERFGVHIVEGYGLTETKNITYNPLVGRRIGSIGKPTATSIVEIHDENGVRVGPGVVGEIVYRPRVAHVMTKGYHHDADATVQAMSDLWWHTGDLGYADDDGFLYFVDRKKDALRRRGENISSQEVEAAIRQYTGVLDAAVVAAASELGEDEILAVVHVARADTFTREALFEHCDRVLPHFMVPRFYRIVEDVPKTPTGKIRKVTLRADGVTRDTWDAHAAGLRATRTV